MLFLQADLTQLVNKMASELLGK